MYNFAPFLLLSGLILVKPWVWNLGSLCIYFLFIVSLYLKRAPPFRHHQSQEGFFVCHLFWTCLHLPFILSFPMISSSPSLLSCLLIWKTFFFILNCFPPWFYCCGGGWSVGFFFLPQFTSICKPVGLSNSSEARGQCNLHLWKYGPCTLTYNSWLERLFLQ